MKKTIYLLCLMALTFSFAGKVLAEEAPKNLGQITIVATTGIEEAMIVSQDNNKIKLKFKINNQEGNQPDIRYAVELTEKVSNILADNLVYEEILSLGSGETISREIEYTAPTFLSGNFSLWIKAFNEKGLPLGIGMAGEIKLAGSNEYLAIAAKDCYLSVKNEPGNKKYSTGFGVDVDTQEELTGRCKITSKFKAETIFSPSIKTYRRSYLGKLIKTDKLESLALKPEESQNFSFVISKASEPQAYDAALTFFDEKGNPVSSTIPFRYVLRGQSATIQNLRLDKNYYQKGEIAQVSFNWLPSADNFYGSRKTGTSIREVFFNIEIKNEQGVLCAPAEKRKLKESEIEANFTISITENCANPQVALAILNQEGQTLDETKLAFQSKDIKPEKEGQAAKESGNLKDVLKWIFMITMALITILIVSMVVMNKRKSNPPNILFLILCALAFWAIFFAGSQKAQAAGVTFTVTETYDDCMYSCQNVGGFSWSTCDNVCRDPNDHASPSNSVGTFNVNLNKSVYSPSETIITSGWATGGLCNNGASFVGIEAAVYGYSGGYARGYGWLLGEPNKGYAISYYGTSFINPGVAGNYWARFQGSVFAWHNAGGTQGAAGVDFSVVSPCGNGVVDSGEQCDLGAANNGACPKTCSATCTNNSCGPTADIKANGSDGPITISYNTAAAISWTSTNATSCSVSDGILPDPDWNGTANPNQTSGNLTTAKTYKMECWNIVDVSSGVKSVTVNVTLPPVPVVTLTPNPATINKGESATLIWTPINADYCWASNSSWSGWKTNTGGTEAVSPDQTTTYKMKCSNIANIESNEAEATVCVNDCNMNDQYCSGINYTGNCGQNCTGNATPGWSSWSPCSASCGGGTSTRSRTCLGIIPATETRACNSHPCPPGYREVAPW